MAKSYKTLEKVSKLKHVLSRLSAGLASNDFVPVLTHFCFSKSTSWAITYNDLLLIAIDTELSRLDCAVPATFASIINNLSTETVNLEYTGEAMVITSSGSRKVTLPTLGSDIFVVDDVEPLEDVVLEVNVDKVTTEAFKRLGKIVLEDMYNSLQMGIVLECSGDGLRLYATGNNVLVRSELKCGYKMHRDVASYSVLPVSFCNQLSGWEGLNGPIDLTISDGAAMLDIDASVTAVVRTDLPYDSSQGERLAELFVPYEELGDDDLSPIPPELFEIAVVAGLFGDVDITIKTLDEHTIRIEHEGPGGSVSYYAELENGLDPDLAGSVSMPVGALGAALSLMPHESGEMAIMPDGVYFVSGSMDCIVSLSEG